MKVRNGVLLFGISVSLAACFNPPEFSTTPQIDFTSVKFCEASSVSGTDSLFITISFKDGDGDLGLGNLDREDPYQDVFYALASGGNVAEVSKQTLYNSPDIGQVVKVPAGATGKLVTNRTAQDPAYAGKLPPFIGEFESCVDYKSQIVYVDERNANIIDNTFPDIDTINAPGGGRVYKVTDMFYKRNNPNHRNIDVDFYIKQANGEYAIFDWEKEFCEVSFNQRFPVLSEKVGPLEGSITYAITSVGLMEIFSIRTLNLRIRIRDRSLNVSNDVDTGDFTLDRIRACN